MAEKIEGTDNVFVLGVKQGEPVIPARTPEQVDDMLTESLAIQRLQINDFLGDLDKFAGRTDIVNYGSLMHHLQQECVFHLSALAAAAIIEIDQLQNKLVEAEAELYQTLDSELSGTSRWGYKSIDEWRADR